jgi:hypothetical protein
MRPDTVVRALKATSLVFVATAATLLVLEAGVRVVGVGVLDFAHEMAKYSLLRVWDASGGYYRHVPGARGVSQGVELRYNRFGMRDREPQPKAPGSFRLLVLGDSVTFGPGVAFEDTWGHRLRAALAPAGVDDVVIAGVPGWNTVQEERFLTRWADELEPDLVIVMYVENDYERLSPWESEMQPAAGWRTSLYRTLVLRSRLFEWSAWTWHRYRPSVDRAVLDRMAAWGREETAAGLPFSPSHAGWLDSRAALARMLAFTRARGARLAVFVWHLRDTSNALGALTRLRELGAETGLLVFDTASFFAGRPWGKLVHSIVDPHPNAAGHTLAAEGVARILVGEGLVPKRMHPES